MQAEMIVFIGLQASGKSSFYRAAFADSHELISKDCFPNNRNPGRRQRQLIEEALGAARSVVIDNTNSTVEERADLITLARTFGVHVVGYYFQARLSECLERNRQRQGKACVPDMALFVTHAKLQIPSVIEGFDQLFYVRLLSEGRFEILDWVEGVPDDEPR